MDELIGSFASPGVAAAALGIGVGVVSFFALGLASRKRLELRSAMAWLNALKWRDFARVLTGLLAQRGLQPHEVERKPGDDGFDLLMVRGTTRYVVQCKHGAAFRVTPTAVRELAKVMGIQGADGAIVLTTGRSEPAARSLAEGERIEIIDQEPLWTQLRPLLPETDRRHIAERAEAARNRRLGAVCVAALLAGSVAYLLTSALQPATPAPTSAGAAPAAARPAPGPTAPAPAAARPVPGPTAPAPAADRPATSPPLAIPQAAPAAESATASPAAGPAPIESPEQAPTSEAQIEASRLAAQALAEIAQLSEAQLEARRTEAAALAARLPGIERADWQTRSTLVLGIDGERLQDPEGVTEAVCRELVRFEELRYTRLQLESARESPDYRVRWRQCR